MKKRTMERVVSIANSHEGKAAKRLAESVEQHRKAADQCSQIKNYRDEYNVHFDDLTKAGVDTRTLSQYRQFLGNLEDAIEQQSECVKDAETQMGETRSEWLTRYHRKSALEQLKELRQEEHKASLEKREQKEMDDASGKSRYSDR